MYPTSDAHMTPDEISAYLSGGLTPDRRAAMERHLVRCDECRDDLVAASASRGRAGTRRWVLLGAPAAAAAAIILLLLGQGDPPSTAGSEPPVLRSQPTEGVPTFQAVSPRDGAEVPADSVRFAWRSEGPEVRYRLTLTDEIGDPVREEGTGDTVFVLPPEVALRPGARYFWRVDALLEGAQSSTTGFRSFVVVDR